MKHPTSNIKPQNNRQNSKCKPQSFGIWLFVFLICLGVGCLRLEVPVIAAGEAGQDIAWLKAGVGARPLGMGSAFTAVADNADAPYWNPAGLGFQTSSEITSMQTKLSSDADHFYLSYVQPMLAGTFGVSWIQVGMGSLTQTTTTDSHNEVQNISIFSSFSNAFLLSYGREINDRLSIGLTGKYLTSDMTNQSGGQAYGYSVTPGILFVIRPSVSKLVSNVGSRESSLDANIDRRSTIKIGLKIDELFNQQKWGTGTVETVPPILRLGLAYRWLNPGLLSVDIAQILKSGYAASASLGYEWAKDGLSFRMGYGDGLTAGAGFVAGIARVDYAYVTQTQLSRNNVHRISISGIW